MTPLIDRERRARAKARKVQSTGIILDAARRAFATKALAGLSLPTIGQMAGVKSGKPELYFGSLEELFLQVLSEEVEFWAVEFQAIVRRPPRILEPERLGRRVALSLADHGLLARMWSLSHQVLETQVDVSAAISAVNGWQRTMEDLGAIAARRCPSVAPDAAAVVQRCLDIAGALHPVCHPSGARALAASRAGSAPDWGAELKRVLPAVVASYAQ